MVLYNCCSSVYAQQAVIDTQLLQALQQSSSRSDQLTQSIGKSQSAQLASNVAQATATASNTYKSYQSMTGNLSLNSALDASFNFLLSNYENLYQRGGGVLLDNKNAADVKKLLTEKIFSTKDDKRQDVYKPLMKKYHSDSSMATLQLTQTVIGQASENIERIQNTAKKADSNQDLKAAMDVNNTLLTQIAMGQEEIKQLLAQIGRALVSKDFEGTTNKVVKLEKTRMERIKGSTKNDNVNEVFKIKSADMPYKRRGTSMTDKIFKGRGF